MFKQNFLLKDIHEMKHQFISGMSVPVEQSLLGCKKGTQNPDLKPHQAMAVLHLP